MNIEENDNSNDNNNDIETRSKFREYYDLLNDISSELSQSERIHLRDLLFNGNEKEFKRSYWQHVKNINANNEFKQNSNEFSTISYDKKSHEMSELLHTIKEFRKTNASYASRLQELEETNATLTLKNEYLDNLNLERETIFEQALTRIKQLEASNSELQSRVQQERIDEKIPGYVESVKKELGSDDRYFIIMAQIWAITGGLFGMLAVSASFYTLYIGTDINSLKGFELLYFFTRGLIGISILSWLSYICLSNSKKYTHESILRKDRRHALMFGQVFLQIYGSTSTKDDAVLVFKDWNMSGNSAFSDKTELPPGIQSFWDAAKEKLKPAISEKAQN